MKKTTILALAAFAGTAQAQTYSHSAPNGMNVMSGWKQYGNIGYANVADDLPVIVTSPSSGTPIQVLWEASAIIEDFQKLDYLKFYIEGRQGYFGSAVSFALRNWETGAWDLVSVPWWSTTDLYSVFQTAVRPERYVSPGGIVALKLHSQYASQNVHCLDMLRFEVQMNNTVRGPRSHYTPTSVFMNQGTWVSGYWASDLRFADGNSLVADSRNNQLDWQCDFTGVALPLKVNNFELTLTLGTSSQKVTNVWLYNFLRRRWDAAGATYGFEMNNFRVPIKKPASEYVSGGRVRARFLVGSSTRQYVDMVKLTVVN